MILISFLEIICNFTYIVLSCDDVNVIFFTKRNYYSSIKHNNRADGTRSILIFNWYNFMNNISEKLI